MRVDSRGHVVRPPAAGYCGARPAFAARTSQFRCPSRWLGKSCGPCQGPIAKLNLRLDAGSAPFINMGACWVFGLVKVA
jgi:hypothetical protein